MLKLVGSVLIMAACIGYTGYLLEKQKAHRDVLQALISMLDLLSGKLRYERMTMGEALAGLNKKYHGAVGCVMGRIADRLMAGNCENLESIWRTEFAEAQKELMLTEEEMDIVLETGKNLGYLDVDMQERTLKLYLEQLDLTIDYLRQNQREKCRLYTSLGIMGGMFLVIVMF